MVLLAPLLWLGSPCTAPPPPLLRALRPIPFGVGVICDFFSFTPAFQLNAMTNSRDLFDDASEHHDALIEAAMEQSMEQCEWGREQCDSDDEGEVGMAMDEAYLEDCE